MTFLDFSQLGQIVEPISEVWSAMGEGEVEGGEILLPTKWFGRKSDSLKRNTRFNTV